MKKREAMELAIDRSKLIIEYITQILSDSEKVTGDMTISSAKINGQNMTTLDIYVPDRDFEKHLNLGITSDHSNILCKQLLDDLLEIFPYHETMGVSFFCDIRAFDGVFTGIKAYNVLGSEIKINMHNIDYEIADEYDKKYEMIIEKIKSNEQSNNKTI